MPLTAPSRRDRAAGAAADEEAAERQQRSVRERLEATVSGVRELEYLRERQEELVRTSLELRGEEEQRRRRREAQLSSEEKLLEENILLLRKQLNCLRRRDAGLISQLQELDRQISDLRLDTEESRDQLEMDSRPSSGFYELSDGVSGSLSNSSNSVFSECFCSMAEADGRLWSADELAGCLDCDCVVGGLCDDSSCFGTVRRSLSAFHPATLDPVSSVASCDSQSKYHCDLVARNSSNVYHYPSPLHAVAVQSPVFQQILGHGGSSRDEGTVKGVQAGVEGLRPESSPLSGPLVCQSSSWPVPSSSSSHKQLDGYIYSLLQRKALPVRTSRPRTSISTEPSKSVLRQAGLCGRSGSGLGTLRGSEFKPSWPAGGASAEGVATSSPERHWSVDGKPEEQWTQTAFSPDAGIDTMQNGFQLNSDLSSSPLSVSSSVTNKDTNSLLKQKNRRLPPPSAVTKDVSPKDNPSPKTNKQPCYCPNAARLLKSPPVHKTSSSPPKTVQIEKIDEVTSLDSSSRSHGEAGGEGGSHMVNAKYIPTQQQNVKLHKDGSKNLKTVKVKTAAPLKTTRASEHSKPPSDHHRSSCRKSRQLEDGGTISIKVSKRAAGSVRAASTSRIKCVPASIPEGQVLDKHTTSTVDSMCSGASRHHHLGNHHGHHHRHHHRRNQVVVIAKPKHKRNDYRWLRAIMEVPHDEAFRHTQQQQRQERYLPAADPVSSPYSYVAGSDSEYSAECASLFHSTIVDTSEDDRSNYTTNCFGDRESSEEDYVEESATTIDTEENSGGCAGGEMGRLGRQLGAAGPRAEKQEVTPAQNKAFVKIKASHNLKKKILRFRSGSLKLMTTM